MSSNTDEKVNCNDKQNTVVKDPVIRASSHMGRPASTLQGRSPRHFIIPQLFTDWGVLLSVKSWYNDITET